jgi:hypothetical protein
MGKIKHGDGNHLSRYTNEQQFEQQRLEREKPSHTPITGNEMSKMAPKIDPMSCPGPDAHYGPEEYGHNVTERYMHKHDLAVNHVDANEKSERTSEEAGKFGNMGRGNYEEFTTAFQGEHQKIDRVNANPSMAFSKAKESQYEEHGIEWYEGKWVNESNDEGVEAT